MFLGKEEYDKIFVNEDPKDVILKLAAIPRPGFAPDECEHELTDEQWYTMNLAIKLIMDAYGIHVNHKMGLLMHDEDKGDILADIHSDKRPKYWWMDRFPTKYNSDTKQMETIKPKRNKKHV